MTVDNSNELAVDFATAAQEAQAEAAQDAVTEQQLTEQDAQVDALDVPDSPFWGEESSDSQDSDSELSANGNPSKGSQPGTITYKVDGKEVTVSLDEAMKKLSLADGARRAFSEKAKLAKQLEAERKQREELAKFKDSWDKLEDMRHDPEKLYELIFNKPYAELEKEVYERKKLYAEASPEERQLLEYEARMRNLERDNERTRRDAERAKKEVEERQFDTERTQLQTQMEREFFKHKVVDSSNPQVSNKLKTMLWRQSVADLKDLTNKGFDVNSKIIAKVFKDNADALSGFKSEVLNKEVKATVDAKKADAKTKAQLAATSNYSSKIPQDLTKLDPLSLFNKMRGRR